MTLEKIKQGATYYRVKRNKGLGISFYGEWSTWKMTVIEVDQVHRRVLASGYAGTNWWYENEWSKWRVKKPETNFEKKNVE